MKEKFNILFLSNMMAEKGVWTLMDACKIVQERAYSFECHFVGKWSDITEEAFLKYRAEHELDKIIRAHGAKYGNDKTSFWKNADLFILPTYNECFPLTLLEAMQQGIACIASNEGGIADIIEEGKTGFIVEKKNALQLADKIEVLIKDNALCQQIGKAGREKFLAEFTLEKFENRIKEIFENELKK